MTSMGPTEVFVFVVGLPLLILPIWAIVDALTRPDRQWAAADQNKVLWVIVLALGMFAFWIGGFVLAIVYFVSIRPKLRGAM